MPGRTNRVTRRAVASGACGLLALALSTQPGLSADDERQAEEPPREAATARSEPDPTESDLFERVRVVGSPEAAERIPGGVTFIDREELARHEHDDVHRVLGLAPGVHVQEEEGYGLRPNIGMRGTGVERSAKITLLEDGVLIAPAPYAAPSAYYFPTIGRMEGVEIRKGSASIEQGPFTNGGVLNLLSSSIPTEFGGEVELALGDDATRRGRMRVGDSGSRFGWLVETYRFDTEGFKSLDSGGESGYDLADSLVKLRYTSRPEAATFQAVELKLGTTEQEGDETYLGLTRADFAVTPFRRYAGSQEDRIDTDHDQVQLRYLVRPAAGLDVTATVYRNDFFRNWHKLEAVDVDPFDNVGAVGVADVLADPAAHAAELGILRAELTTDSADGALRVRNNRREYYSEGIHVVVGFDPDRGPGGRHALELGVRYHEDAEDRFQEDDGFRMTASGEMVQTSQGAPGSQANRITSAGATALFARDTITLGRLTLTPGLRFESIDFEQVRWAGNDPRRTNAMQQPDHEVDELIPGAGAHWALSARAGLFAGVHRGFAPPGLTPGADSETSWNWEAGWRRHAGALRAEAIGFYNDYQNLLAACTLSVGCSSAQVGDVFNGGEVTVQGFETALEYDFGLAHDLGFGVPVRFVGTVTHGEFDSSFESEYEPWGAVSEGDELPYLPEYQAGLSAGFVRDSWAIHGQLTWTDAMRTEAGRGTLDPGASTDSHLLLDLSGRYTLGRGLRAFVHARNVTDEVYVAALRPAGVRPGIGRTLLAGLGYDF